jgi:hypothetical protein
MLKGYGDNALEESPFAEMSSRPPAMITARRRATG